MRLSIEVMSDQDQVEQELLNECAKEVGMSKVEQIGEVLILPLMFISFYVAMWIFY
jgi:RNA-binding protein YhbY